VDCANATATVCKESEWEGVSTIRCLTHLGMTQRNMNARDTFALSSRLCIAMESDGWHAGLIRKDFDVLHCSGGTP